jgi:hypothetical protein
MLLGYSFDIEFGFLSFPNFIWERDCRRNFVARVRISTSGVGHEMASASAFPSETWEREGRKAAEALI